MTLLSELAYVSFQKELAESGLLVPTAIDGIYLRSKAFERIVRGLDDLISNSGLDQGAEAFWAPPLMARENLDRTDYIRSFPNLTGIISSYSQGEHGYGELLAAVDSHADWSNHFESSDIALCPAACHSIYPMLEHQLLKTDRRFEVFGQCFRHEPSNDPMRMQAFRMHEFVYVGTSAGAWQHRDLWIDRGLYILSELGLEVEAVTANDPFFGRSGGLLAESQRSESLKIELVSPIFSETEPTAISSGNCHLEHFGSAFAIESEPGVVAHSACFGFGDERIALALLRRHGLQPTEWPSDIREQLNL